MQINLEWLADFVDVPPVAELAALLTNAGVEVEEIRDPAAALSGVVVARVDLVEPHPHADRLQLCKVTDGARGYNVVCGAPNVAEGQIVALAKIGAELPALTIAPRTIRKVASEGMLCGRADLGLEEESAGIWVLDQATPLGADLKEAVSLPAVLTLGITPNRPDLLSHVGVAREVAAATGKRLRSSKRRPTELGPDAASLARVVVDDSDGCRRYTARVVRSVVVGPSPDWLRLRLESVGQRSINNVVDATNYVLQELGHPLHAFDLARVAPESGLPTIRVRRATSGEELTTLDGEKRSLDPDDVVIGDGERAVALGGVMGGANSEVAAGTTAVLLESAWFDPVRIRRSARCHGLHSESSHRFERTADPQALVPALDRCAQIIAETCSGEVAKGVLEVSQKSEPAPEIPLRLDRVARVLGVRLATENVVQLLDPLGIRCCARNEDSLRFEPPSFRPDLTREIDLIEELARRHGYDNTPERLPGIAGEYTFEPMPEEAVASARASLLASGVSEAVCWGIGSPEAYASTLAGAEDPLRLKNPIGEELSALRTSLLPGLLTVVGRNQRHGARQSRVFEIGFTFHRRDPDETEDQRDWHLPREVRRLGLVLWGARHDGRWYEGGATTDAADLFGIVENLGDRLGIHVQRRPAELPGLHPLAAAEVCSGGEVIGLAGQLHPDRVSALEMNGPVFVAEIDLDGAAATTGPAPSFSPLPKLPGTRRDVAVVADRSVPAESLRAFLAREAGGELGRDVVERVHLFDVYRGKSIAETKVSLAFAIDYRHPQRTLTDAEVNRAFETVLEKLEKAFDVEVRQ